MKSDAFFSIAMSVYDGVKLEQLQRSVQSILQQSYGEFEFYIVLDGVTRSDLKDFLFSLSDTRIQLIVEPENKGLANAMNRIIREFEGSYFVRMDADDASALNRLEVAKQFIEDNPNVDVFGSACYQGELSTVSLEQCIEKDYPVLNYPSSHNEIVNLFLIRNPIIHPTMVAKKAVIKSFQYPIYSFRNEDTLLWLTLIKAGYVFSNIEEPLYYFDFDESGIGRRVSFAKAYSDFLDRLRVIFDLGGSMKHFFIAFCAFMVTVTPFYRWVRNYVIKN